MSLEQGLITIRSNYDVSDLVETDTTVVVTTYSSIQAAERAALTREGWVIQDDRTVVFTKEVVDVDEDTLPPDGPPEEPVEDGLVQNPPSDQPVSTETK